MKKMILLPLLFISCSIKPMEQLMTLHAANLAIRSTAGVGCLAFASVCAFLSYETPWNNSGYIRGPNKSFFILLGLGSTIAGAALLSDPTMELFEHLRN